MVDIIVAAGMALLLAAPAPVTVTAEGVSLDKVTCQISNDADSTSSSRLRRSPTAIEWSCMPGDRLQCDAPSLEPIDLNADACTKPAAALRFRKSGPVQIDVLGSAIVEWRAESGGTTRLIATREIGGTASVPVASGGRVLRIYQGKYSPVSSYVTPDSRLRVPRPQPGGEIFGRVEKRKINPVAVIIEGVFEAEIPVDASGRFSRAGITPGEYKIAPLYTGGIRGAAKPIRVDDSLTTDVPGLAKDSVGGVILVVVSDACDPTDTLTLTKVQAQSRSATFAQVIRKSLSEGCEWQFEGLLPGRYEASTQTVEHRDLKALEEFAVQADALGWVNVGEPRVVVEGRVTLGEKPAARVLVTFQPPNRSTRLWVTETDADGGYRIVVDRPGMYSAEVRPTRRVGAQALGVMLHDGVNKFDMRLAATRLTVKLERSDGLPIDEIVSVHLTGLPKDRSGFVLPKEGQVLEFPGIPVGNYVVTADTNSGLASTQPGIVAISKDVPEASVTLRLGVSEGELRLIWGDRSPVQGARVQISARVLDEEAPGVFSLRSAAPGSQVLVSAPGAIPICHVLDAREFPQATLSVGRGTHSAEIHLSPPVTGPVGEITGLPGSSCSIPLGLFSFGATEDHDTTTIRIVGLPEGRFSYRPSASFAFKILEVPGGSVSFVKPKPQK